MAAVATDDVITQLQDDLLRLAQHLTSLAEETQQVHAPEAAPLPPAGQDPAAFYHDYWRRRHEERPFATRGFEHEAMSGSGAARTEAVKKRARDAVTMIRAIKARVAETATARSEAEQLQELARLDAEGEEARAELEAAVARANDFLGKVAGLQRQVAKGALGF